MRSLWRREQRSPEEAFADEVANLVPRLLPVQRVERGEDFSLRLTLRDRTPVVMFLQNIFAEASRLEGAARDDRLRRAVLAMAPADRPTSWPQAEGRVLPAVRSPSWAAASSGRGVFPVRRVLAPFVLLLTAVDDEHSMSFVSEDDLRRWGVDADLVERTALANLVRDAVQIHRAPDGPWLEVLGPDGYVSSWLAYPEALRQVASPLGDGFVALAPSRDSLRLIAADDRAVLQKELEKALQGYREAPRQLSPVPYTVRDGELVVWRPSSGDPCLPSVERAELVLAATEYGYQHQVLIDLFEKAAEDVFVAKFEVVERSDGSVWSYAAWVRGVTDALLPQTDHLSLVDTAAGTIFLVRWEDAATVAAEALQEEPGYYPARFRVRGWPADEVVEELRKLAVEPGTRR